MKYLRHINACNNGNIHHFKPFYIEQHHVGFIRPAFAKLLFKHSKLFVFEQEQIRLNDKIQGFEQRTAAFTALIKDFIDLNIIQQYYNEPYPIVSQSHPEPFCCIDRFSASYFGLRAFGQHLNGVVETKNGLEMWIARRAKERVLFPNKLDNMVAGGLPYGKTAQQNLIKECAEEAGMSDSLTHQAKAVSVITYNAETKKGFRPDVIYCYDILLDEDFIPVRTDDEVECFYRWPIEKIIDIVKNTDDFKLNCNLVIIDFLIRWGYIEPQTANYVEISTRLRTPLAV